jgi:cell wall-associated NlpC family hydrolase
MFRLIFLCCLTIGLAHAAPASGDADDLEARVNSSLVVTEISHISQRVGNQASELVLNAMGFLGVPYKRGGTGITGFDCSGFVRAMYENTLGLVLPHNAKEQAAVTQTIDKDELQPGDLVFFNTLRRAFSHVGIYVGEGRFIHSPRAGGEVRIENMSDSYWRKRFNGARRVNPSTLANPTNSALR